MQKRNICNGHLFVYFSLILIIAATLLKATIQVEVIKQWI